MATPEITVVVPVRNGAGALPPLLRALAAQTLSRERYEVVVVDNASTDATAEVASRLGARVVREPQRGRARARNIGVAVALAPLVAFTDADCAPAERWLEQLAGCLGQAPLAAGPVELMAGEPPNKWERLEGLWRFRQPENVARGWAATANLGVRRDAFERTGGFDVTYRQIGEDVDFGLRARAAGLAIVYCPGAVVRHRAEHTAGAVLRRGASHGYSSTQHDHRWPGEVGWRHWRHPLPAVAGDWALRRFGPEAQAQRDLIWVARAENAARVAGSAWAELRGVR